MSRKNKMIILFFGLPFAVFISYILALMIFLSTEDRFYVDSYNKKTINDIYWLLGDPTHDFSMKGFVGWQETQFGFISNSLTIRGDFSENASLDVLADEIKASKSLIIYDTTLFSLTETSNIKTQHSEINRQLIVWPFGVWPQTVGLFYLYQKIGI
ncbi:hypothetical protein [Thorsellia anophelis]|uniref:Uncharacterized protein n=1 Tax=Thorsellia anophelis DSM 18579 TaxID=1123402 RepID=A0A1H9Z6K0_9GAMM|nr:hypothetical protein [Thorsellia anophelis]SES77127.1 hypothetical protein SAMN02583745_00444 [Thorsellia anophelis DSM 18579]